MTKLKIQNSRYQKVEDLVPGGMGEVTLCMDGNLKRQVVVKCLQDGIEHRRLVNEQKALLELRSKHVVQLFDLIDATDNKGNSVKALVLEHIAGKALNELTFSYDITYLRTLWQIACGLCQIHSANVVHRDIKLQNIMMDGEGVIKIIDFGLAKIGSEADTVTIIGSPPFMAPELYGLPTISFDSAVDIYAFGVVALALLGFNPPSPVFARPPGKISFADLASTHGVIPNEILVSIHNCLDHDRSKRPTATELENILSRHILKGRHTAFAATDTQTFTANRINPRVALHLDNIGSITVFYDEFDFIIEKVTGAVSVNNRPATVGMKIPGCCVLTFGATGPRKFLTFDVSNPEVMP